MSREKWSSRSTFILAAVGSAVGLGNAWRFPGLAAKHGGGSFLLVYLVALVIIGVPLLTMEIAIGRKMRQSAPGALRGLNKKFEAIGWMATSNAFVIASYYAVVFAWVLIMIFGSLQFINMTGDADSASQVWANITQTTWDVTGYTIPVPMIIALVVGWGAIYYCIRNGAQSVGKVVKYTVFVPVILLVLMAGKGISMPGSIEGLTTFFIPDLSALGTADLWIDAIGQVFYSMSIMMAIMFAYGSYLDDNSNIAVDALIIAFADLSVSVLSGIVMYSTMAGVGALDTMSASGIATAFIVYPMTIVNLTDSGIVNVIFGIIFYITLVTLAIDSAFSIIEGVSAAIADKFETNRHKTTIYTCMVAGVVSLLFATRAGLAWLDIVDHWTNMINLIFIGVLECIAIGWFFSTRKVLDEVNANTKNFKMPSWWFNLSIKYVSPAVLIGLFGWNLYSYFSAGAVYGYAQWAEFLGGWVISILVILSGFIMRAIINNKKKKGFQEFDKTWDEMDDLA